MTVVAVLQLLDWFLPKRALKGGKGTESYIQVQLAKSQRAIHL
jgi:hypothetical protein